ncbi:hypothetical protein BIY24_03640 [Halobacteriovorax marinus]|uniref:hypothetical protein n=1 Tax=Halobacteriovorax marinus TaxID=97084 RepID=UPI000BC32761|nr:hypothetical protein [Halobacteriovorax marinus]ATH07059.1 hypothetical protein BIY24_03640 [Halobacteriovorax marinus]
MKKLFILAASIIMTASASAHMPTASDSWSTIKKHFTKVTFQEPSVKLDNGPMTSAFFVCKDGDVLKTKKAISKCVEWDWRGSRREGDRVCTREVEYYGVAAIEGTRERCAKWDWRGSRREGDRVCVAYETYNYTLPLSHEIDVHRVTRSGRDRDDRVGRKLFTKTLSIEDCE